MNRQNKILGLLLFALMVLFTSSGADVYAEGTAKVTNPGLFSNFLSDLNPLGLNPDVLTNPQATMFQEYCTQYPGFINKIVQCVTHMTTREKVMGNLMSMYTKFAGAANALLILYICLFGLKLSLNAVDNARGEIMMVILTCFFMTYFLNVSRLDKFIYFFVGFQNEFANITTAAIYTQEAAEIAKANSSGQDLSQSTKYICYGETDSAGKLQPNKHFTVWQRADCLFAYMIGVHPLVQRLGQYYDENGSGSPDKASTHPGNFNKSKDYGLWATNRNPFAQMAEDPFCFYDYSSILNFDTTDSNKVQDFYKNAQKSENYCLKKILAKAHNPDELAKLARASQTDKYASSIAFATGAILVGIIFGDPTIGLLVFITGFFVIFIMLAAFAQAALIYIASYIAILFLGLIAPLTIPCFLFKYTRKMVFEKWVQMLFVYSIQPGMVLCYLTFMLAVLQFLTNYGSTSFVDYTIGDLYKKADQSYKPAVLTANPQASGVSDATYGENTISNIQKKTPEYKNNTTLYYNASAYYGASAPSGGSRVFLAPATQTVTQNRASIYDIKTADPHMNIGSLDLPNFNFFSKDFADKYKGTSGSLDDINSVSKANFVQFLNLPFINPAGSANGNINQAANLASKDPANIQQAIQVQSDFDKSQYQLKLGYMQYLLILFIAMTICLSFLSNVIRFGGQLAGVSNTPISKMINVYDLMQNKLDRILKS